MKVEITMEKSKRMAREFEVTEEEYKLIECGELPEWIDKEFDEIYDWSVADTWTDWAVWDCDKEKQIVDWQ